MAREITRLFDFAYYQLEKFNLENALNTKYDGKWISTSTKELINKVKSNYTKVLEMDCFKNFLCYWKSSIKNMESNDIYSDHFLFRNQKN